jgi:hypothetical protein
MENDPIFTFLDVQMDFLDIYGIQAHDILPYMADALNTGPPRTATI